MNVITHLLKPDGPIPNHPRWPLVGAYPQGSHPDTCTAVSKGDLETVARVPLPPADPVYGPVGPLFDHWK